MRNLSTDDMWFCMETAMLEISVQENVELSDLKIIKSKKTENKFYVTQGKKVWFAKQF